MLKDCAEMPVTPFISNSGNWEKKSKALEAVRYLIFSCFEQLESVGILKLTMRGTTGLCGLVSMRLKYFATNSRLNKSRENEKKFWENWEGAEVGMTSWA